MARRPQSNVIPPRRTCTPEQSDLLISERREITPKIMSQSLSWWETFLFSSGTLPSYLTDLLDMWVGGAIGLRNYRWGAHFHSGRYDLNLCGIFRSCTIALPIELSLYPHHRTRQECNTTGWKMGWLIAWVHAWLEISRSWIQTVIVASPLCKMLTSSPASTTPEQTWRGWLNQWHKDIIGHWLNMMATDARM